jgi:hypothetical protein
MAVIIPDNFGNMKKICFNRAQISDEQPENVEFFESALNEYYMTICTERSWTWRKAERDFNFNKAVQTGTSAVTNNSREAVLTGLTVDDSFLYRSIRFGNDREVYRIVGVDVVANSILLSALYVGDTNPEQTHRIYKYEFALPPNLDTLDQVYIDTGGVRAGRSGAGAGELDPINVIEFNQLMSVASSIEGTPEAYTRDGQISAEDLPPLDVMVADHDFLGGNQWDQVPKLRLFPITPDQNRVIHLNYTLLVEPLIDDAQVPIMPFDNRWVIIHYALGEWWKTKGAGTMSDREFGRGDKILKEMRAEFQRTDVKPKIVFDASRHVRQHGFRNRRYLHYISRLAETGSV